MSKASKMIFRDTLNNQNIKFFIASDKLSARKTTPPYAALMVYH